MSMTPEQELELLRLKVRILELEKEKYNLAIQSTEELVTGDEPVPVAVPTAQSAGYITREQLEKLTPGELFILAKKKGISVERIFPI